MTATSVQAETYVFDANRTEEERRLIAQARLTDPIAERFLREAGVSAGMHVLDLGSGAGDTALLAARLVGETGSVLGIERSPETVALAQRRIGDAGVHNVRFRQGDVVDLQAMLAAADLQEVDVVMGRLILMWVPDRAAVLRACAEGLKPGTLVWFMEGDLTYDYAMPAGPQWSQLRTWVIDTLGGLGVELRMGPRLCREFRDAGLPEPELRTVAVTAGAQSAPVWFWTNIVRGVLPAMEKLGIATAAEVDLPTLEERLKAELEDHRAAMILPLGTIAWTRIP
jgi:SAM-dependent methyltransferase